MSQDPARNFGQYSLLKLLAKGGMGEIYLARTGGINQFEKYYAVKRLLKKFAHDKDVSTRFVDEAKLGARLQHPNIVQVYDLGAIGDELYMATEFVDGFDLRRVLRFCQEKKRRIPLDIALFIVREVLSGLAYAHRQVDAEGKSINLIHRDISPQNVLVSFEGEVKIIDFGLAKSTQRSHETQANVLLGNFGYMSPEQARGHKLDVRTDVYSAGIVLFELVTGIKRFVDENPLRLLEMVARPTPIMPSDRAKDIPHGIDRIYAGATAPAREDRFASAESFRDEVTTALHKLNPRATREHLAQFLNHLFLGGAAPPPVDNDLLNKSVAVKVHAMLGLPEGGTKPEEAEGQDRSLAAFCDDAPQTGSHPLMRAARVGDTLSHPALTGEPGPPGSSPDDVSRAEDTLPAPVVAWGAHAEASSASLASPTSVYEAPQLPAAVPLGKQPPDPLTLLELTPIDPGAHEPTVLHVTARPPEPVAHPEDVMPSPGSPGQAPPTPGLRGQGAPALQRPAGQIVSTLRAAASPPLSPEALDAPTVVVDFDSMPGAVLEERVPPPAIPDEGGSNDSLLIDFDVQSEEGDSTLPPPVQSPWPHAPSQGAARPLIRPAAQPLGRVLRSRVVQPSRPGATNKPEPPRKR